MKGKKKSFEDISETLLGQEIFDFFQLEKSGTLVTTQFTCIHVLTLLRTSTDANSCPVSVTQNKTFWIWRNVHFFHRYHCGWCSTIHLYTPFDWPLCLCRIQVRCRIDISAIIGNFSRDQKDYVLGMLENYYASKFCIGSSVGIKITLALES